jgi:hypothetical protein
MSTPVALEKNETASYSLDAIDSGPRYLLKQILELHSTLNDF